MAMTRCDFNNILREAISSEFANIPTDERCIYYDFSNRFHKKMEKLIRSQKKVYYSLINTAAKRVAIILLIAVTLFTTACSVKAIREPVVNFIKHVYETFTHYSFEGETTDKISKEYFVAEVPEGFEQTNKITNDAIVVTEFTHASGDVIEFTQMTTAYAMGYFVDNEYSDITTEIINGIEVAFKKWYDVQSAIWSKDGYVFSLDCYGDLERNVMIDIIKSIK